MIATMRVTRHPHSRCSGKPPYRPGPSHTDPRPVAHGTLDAHHSTLPTHYSSLPVTLTAHLHLFTYPSTRSRTQPVFLKSRRPVRTSVRTPCPLRRTGPKQRNTPAIARQAGNGHPPAIGSSQETNPVRHDCAQRRYIYYIWALTIYRQTICVGGTRRDTVKCRRDHEAQ